jgi:hypothetical protein
MYGRRTAPLPASVSLAWLPAWVWVPGFLLASPSPSSPSSSPSSSQANGNGRHANGNGHIKENPRIPRTARRLKTPFAPRKSTAGFAAACVTGALVALAFWLGLAGLRGVAEMRAVAEGASSLSSPLVLSWIDAFPSLRAPSCSYTLLSIHHAPC